MKSLSFKTTLIIGLSLITTIMPAIAQEKITPMSSYWEAYRYARDYKDSNPNAEQASEKAYRTPEYSSDVRQLADDIMKFQVRRRESVGNDPGKYKSEISTDKKQINNTQQQFGKMPGGILLTGFGKFSNDIKTVSYNNDHNSFLINGKYIYKPTINREEIAVIWDSIFNGDGFDHFGATSQDSFSGLEPDNIVAVNLSLADTLLGAIAYGYTTDLNIMNTKIKNYENPFLYDLSRIKEGSFPDIKRIVERQLRMQNVRLFLQIGDINFNINKNGNNIKPGSHDIKIFFNTFNKESLLGITFTSRNPEDSWPAVARATQHMSANFNEYVKDEPVLEKVIEYGEVLSFFKIIKSNSISVAGVNNIRVNYLKRKKYTILWDTYINQSKRYSDEIKTTLAILENKIQERPLDRDNKFYLSYLLWNFSTATGDVLKAKKYREQLYELIYVLENGITREDESSQLYSVYSSLYRLKNRIMGCFYKESGLYSVRWNSVRENMEGSCHYDIVNRLLVLAEEQAYDNKAQKFYAGKAIEWLNKQINNGLTDESILRGRAKAYIILKNYKSAIADLKKAVKINSSSDMTKNFLANVYLEVGNKQQAYSLFHETCGHGSESGCINIAEMYRKGNIVIKDPAKSLNLFETYCSKGSGIACNGAGMIYQSGEGAPADIKKAISYYTKACQNDDPWGCINLAITYSDENGTESDYKKSEDLFNIACSNGYATACNRLGVMYSDGKKIKLNSQKAIYNFKIACRKNDPFGCWNLAIHYANGIGIEKNISQARLYAIKSCNNGNSDACKVLRR